MGGQSQRSTFRGPMVLNFEGQWSGANGLGANGPYSFVTNSVESSITTSRVQRWPVCN